MQEEKEVQGEQEEKEEQEEPWEQLEQEVPIKESGLADVLHCGKSDAHFLGEEVNLQAWFHWEHWEHFEHRIHPIHPIHPIHLSGATSVCFTFGTQSSKAPYW